MSADLKPCPFCGTAPEVRKIGNEHTRMAVTIRCPECRTERTDATPKALNKGDHEWLLGVATKNWNRRPPTPPEKGALLEAIERAAKELPDGYSIRLEVEQGYGGVAWSGSDTEWHPVEGEGFLSDDVTEAVDLAVALHSAALPQDLAKEGEV